MLFNSYVFILLFLPLTLILYYGLNKCGRIKAAKIVLIFMSIWFYAYFHWKYVFILVASILVNYVVIEKMEKQQETSLFRKGLLIFGILANIGAIGYYKYLDFIIENINRGFGTELPLRHILMPLGISFFTFQQISCLVDSYRGETKGLKLIDYALFVSFFPQLIAGPIVSQEEMIPQFADDHRKKFSQEEMARGIYLFAVGLFKKVILADTLGAGADWGFGIPESLTRMDTLVVSLLYTFQIYFDFSGYCDMACGIAAMFHMKLPVNFNSPYKALSIADFWKRWHMTLTRFLTKYVYIPMGGNRKGKSRTLLNIFVVFLVSGIWHGAAWTFILWGIVHGIAMILYRLTAKIWDRIPRILRWAATFAFVNFTWVIFRAESLQDVMTLFRNSLFGAAGGISGGLIQCFNVIEFTYMESHVGFLKNIIDAIPALHVWIMLAISFIITVFAKNCHEKEFVPTPAKALGCVVMLIWSVLSLSGLSSFLYFNF